MEVMVTDRNGLIRYWKKTFKMIQRCHRLRNLLHRYCLQKRLSQILITGDKFCRMVYPDAHFDGGHNDFRYYS